MAIYLVSSLVIKPKLQVSNSITLFLFLVFYYELIYNTVPETDFILSYLLLFPDYRYQFVPKR